MISQEDFESLGWKRHEDTDRYDNNPYMLIYRKGIMNMHRIAGETLFSGEIQEKQEFKTLLKQLEI